VPHLKLYSTPVSPFAARMRLSLLHKGLEFEDLGLPACGLKGAEFLRINPMGRIPVMILEDQTVIPESETILDYLEDTYPQPPLLLANPIRNAMMRTVIRVLDSYVSPALIRLFSHLDPQDRIVTLANAECQKLLEGIGYLDHYVDDASYAVDGCLTLADCCLLPTLWLCNVIAPQFGITEPLTSAPRLEGYLKKARDVPLLAHVHNELAEAYKSYVH
jgi:glutathione S-transferase